MSEEPRYSVCQLTLPDTSFEEDLVLIAASGASGVSIAEEKLREGDEQAQVAALKGSGLRAAGCIPANIAPLPLRPAVMYPGPEDPRERVALMCDSVRRLARFEPDCIVMTTGSREGYATEEAFRIAVGGIRVAARLATDLGTRIAIEVVRGDGGFDASFVRSLPEVIRLLDAIEDPTVGICYDSYHLWDTPDVVSQTEELTDRVTCVQVSGWREPPRGFADRLLPGDGTEDLSALLGALDRGGFDGWYDLEIFSDDGRWGTDLPDSLWKLPYEELLARGHDGFKRAWDGRRASTSSQ